MRTIFILLEGEVRRFLRDKSGLSLTFLVPIVLIYIFGHVFGVSGDGPSGIPLAVVSETNAPVAATITAALQKEKALRIITTDTQAKESKPLSEAQVRERLRAGSLRFALIFPPDTESDDRFGVRLKFLENPRNEIETQTVRGLLEKTIFTSAPQAFLASLQKRASKAIGQPNLDQFNHSLAEAITKAFGGDANETYARISKGTLPTNTGASSTSGNSFLDKLIKIDSEQVTGAQVKSPMATRSVGGWAMMFLLFSLSGAATSLFDEKKVGLYQRLLSAPVRRTHILWSKYLFGMLVGLVQLGALFTAGHFLFGIDITTNLGNLILICFAASSACVAFGMLLAAIAPTSTAANGMGTFLILTMSAIGGAWFPTSLMPEFIQHLSKLTIVYWSIEGFLQVLWANCTTLELLPTLGILLGIAAVVNIFSIWRFNHGQIFE
ncbi:MAG: ABC transporter permease [Chthoniobacterales bacterium]|nr:ABC transporter permease [Chthoniobacterales bacterium]